MPENTDKTERKSPETGEKWRFFEGLERHFVAATSAAMSLLPASQPDFTPRDRGRGAEPATREICGRAPVFQTEWARIHAGERWSPVGPWV
jgi:hypothetical protein